MFKTKNQAISAMNHVANIAIKLNVEFRCSSIGISIIGPNGAKSFSNASQDELNKAIKFIKEVANPELQTVLTGF